MKKVALLICIIAGAFAFAAQRVVVCENFTATWCQYCPGAARALDENYTRSYDSVLVISYHPSTSDPFYSAEAAARLSYYSVSGYPTTIFDGVRRVVGGLRYGTMYAIFRDSIAFRLNISSPLEINLTCNYDTIVNSGTVNATIQNTTSNQISGTLHFIIVENNIPYSWQGMSKLEFLMRDMVPDANGEAVTIQANNSITRSRNFTIASNWKEKDCKIIVFVQAGNREIYQGAEIGIVPIPNMEYYGMNYYETAGNHNRWAEPGEAIRMYVYGKNKGDGTYIGSTAVTCSDQYITISGATPQIVAIGPGDLDTVNICDFTISNTCPTPRQVSFFVNFGSKVDTIPFIITRTPGFSDNMESGQGGWTSLGTNNNWHITNYKSYSPTHSWYCGVAGSWQYTNQNDASLISPYFVVTPDSSLKFWHQYNLETGWDYGYMEIDNGSGWWQTLGKFTGIQSSWTQFFYPLANYSGQTVRLRFRFISDASVVAEGWYIDDVKIPSAVGIKEIAEGKKAPLLSINPNPFHKRAIIRYQAKESVSKPGLLNIYDTSGCLVKSLVLESNNVWIGDDNEGKLLPSGIYFAELASEDTKLLQKVVIVR